MTAQDDLTHQNAAYEDLTVTASKLVLAKHQHSKPSGKEFALNRNGVGLEDNFSDDGYKEEMGDISL